MTLGSGWLLVINGHCCFSVSSELPTVPFPFVFQQNKKKTKRNATDTQIKIVGLNAESDIIGRPPGTCPLFGLKGSSASFFGH